ncbi:ribosomal protein L28 [Acrasis kona]|uniref:Ribosomal protein L28 n=1 Tax=Acrasis kona TaxID=1008807 RepID=A0AAW2YM61_9EUKA
MSFFDNIKNWLGLSEDKPPARIVRNNPTVPTPLITFQDKINAQRATYNNHRQNVDAFLKKAKEDESLQTAIQGMREDYIRFVEQKKAQEKNPSQKPVVQESSTHDMVIRQFLLDNHRTFQIYTESLMQQILALDSIEPNNDQERKIRKQLILDIQSTMKSLDELKEGLTKVLEETRANGPMIALPEHVEDANQRQTYLPEGLDSTHANDVQELGKREKMSGDETINKKIKELNAKIKKLEKQGKDVSRLKWELQSLERSQNIRSKQ